MKLSIINNNYNKWMTSELDDHRINSTTIGNDADYAKTCLLFVTVMFDQKAISAKRAKGVLGCEPEMEAFRTVYRLASSIADTSSGAAGRRERPLTLFAVDYEGSKYQTFQQAGTKNLHIHSLWAIRPDEVPVYTEALKSLRLRMALASHSVQLIDVRPFDPEKTIDQAVDYVLKGWTKSQLQPTRWIDIGLIAGNDQNFTMPGLKHKRTEPPKARFKRMAKTAVLPNFEPWELAQGASQPIYSYDPLA